MKSNTSNNTDKCSINTILRLSVGEKLFTTVYGTLYKSIFFQNLLNKSDI